MPVCAVWRGMDTHVKAGQVYLQPQKAGKKWKQVWLSLYPPSRSGVGRLEIQDVGGSGGGGAVGGEWPSPVLGAAVRRHHPAHQDRKLRVVRLSELVSVLRLPPHAEACPKENMSAFCVETEERTMVFAAEKDECVDWVERVCDIAFQRSSVCCSQLQMEENQIYASREDVSEFWVVVQQTDAAARCGLQGAYWLQVGQEGLVLREPEKKKSSVQGWPYRLLRRYGKDKLTLSIEAGRRCDSGPGTFTFETRQADGIFSLIESAIKQQKASTVAVGNQSAVAAGNKEVEGVMLTNRFPRSPLPKIPDTAAMAAILENRLKVDSGYSVGSKECVYAQPADSIGSLSLEKECVYSQPVDSISSARAPAPISLLPLPLVPTHHTPPVSHHSGQSEPLYADPVDCVRSEAVPVVTTAVYLDPAKILPLKPPPTTSPTTGRKAPPPPPSSPAPPQTRLHGDHPEPVYSEVYDKVSPVRSKKNPIQSRGKDRYADEPIYTEPTREGEGSMGKTITKPDQFAHLYAQVCKPTPPSASSSTSSSSSNISSSSSSVTRTTIALPPSPSDVIYENLGVI